MKIETIFAVGTGGFIGATLRLYLNGVVNSSVQFLSLPLGTLFVNLLGSFIIGLFFGYIHTHSIPIYIKTFLVTGLLGALTTFSTFAYETLLLLEGGEFGHAILNILLNLSGTLFMVYLGMKLVNSNWLF